MISNRSSKTIITWCNCWYWIRFYYLYIETVEVILKEVPQDALYQSLTEEPAVEESLHDDALQVYYSFLLFIL